MRMPPLLGLALACCLVTVPVLAAEVTVGQKGQKFSPESVTIKAGDTVKFVNDDAVAHNIMSSLPGGGTKNGGLQKAGESTSVTYDKPGSYAINCGIHPKMKMIVKVD